MSTQSILGFVTNLYAKHHSECGDKGLRQVVCAAKQLQVQFGRDVDVAELSEELICSHLRWMRDRGLAPDSRRRRRGHLLTIWKLAHRLSLNSNPFWKAQLPIPKRPKLSPKAWSTHDLEQMLLASDRVRNWQFQGKHWRALLLLIYYTGLRISAVLALRRRDLHGWILTVPYTIQ
ncbi:tyrosine-type recombinase/integrase [Planctomicrobium sp. SH664]|uniref:tyrosine-type recombinase/integrase n=1 Tax=Planctomicrobium sp. SH664 TaxID=3448125 RepID=UPI003F5C575A